MAKGDYSKTTWVNGTAPAINATNLQNIEDKIEDLDTDVFSSTAVSSDTTTVINGSSTGNLVIDTGITGNKTGILFIRRTASSNEYSIIHFGDVSNLAYSNDNNGTASTLLLGGSDLSTEKYASTGADVKITNCVFTGTGNRYITVTFANSNVSNRTLSINYKYVVNY